MTTSAPATATASAKITSRPPSARVKRIRTSIDSPTKLAIATTRSTTDDREAHVAIARSAPRRTQHQRPFTAQTPHYQQRDQARQRDHADAPAESCIRAERRRARVRDAFAEYVRPPRPADPFASSRDPSSPARSGSDATVRRRPCRWRARSRPRIRNSWRKRCLLRTISSRRRTAARTPAAGGSRRRSSGSRRCSG